MAALVLIWAGTFAITIVGVPALVMDLITDEKNQVLTDENGNGISTGPDPVSIKARDHYLVWAVPGMVAISIGMVFQACEPIRTLSRRPRSIS